MAGHDSGGLSAVDRGDGAFSSGDGRRFGFPVGIAFLLLTGVMVWRGYSLVAYGTATIGVLLILGALTVPARLGPVYRAWMGLALAMSKVTTPVLMTFMYFLVLTPVGVLRRTFGRNPLQRGPGDSYWLKRTAGGRGDLRRQF